MRLLLDTHVVLWLAGDAPNIPPKVVTAIRAPDATVLISAVVLWEIAIKSGLKKLKAREDLPTHLAAFDFTPVPVTAEHAWGVRDLPVLHGDPFDRLLIAQAQAERATLVTADAILGRYDVPVLWS